MSSAETAFSVAEFWHEVTPTSRERLRATLLWDMTSEYDARFLAAYFRSSSCSLSAEFWQRERCWEADEERHFLGFEGVYERLFGGSAEILAQRQPDFAPLEHLFQDEFSVLCLLAYDELTTVRGYRVNLALYDQLGPALGRYVREVIADEGRHYGAFLGLARRAHAHRLRTGEHVVQRILGMEGTPYAHTFVLDHDEDIYTDAVSNESASVLLRHLRSRRWQSPGQ